VHLIKDTYCYPLLTGSPSVSASSLFASEGGEMLVNCLRHPIRTLKQVHVTLVHRTITANLEQAREHAANDNYEGFERHCGHAERLAERYVPSRVDDVDRVAAAGPDLLGDATDANQPEATRKTANA
jgi:hypothetical protein